MTDSTSLLDRLLDDPVALSRRQLEADRVIAASGAGHLVHETRLGDPTSGARGPWRIDPIPIVLDGATFDTLAAAVAARMRAFEAILDDLYGARSLVGDGVVAGEALSASPRYRVASVGAARPPRRLTTYAVDVVELADGTWRVVQDLTDAPTGIGFALIDRAAMVRVADEVLGAGAEGSGQLASIGGFPAELRHALVATSTERSPRLVVLSGGVDHAAYVEHSSLARTLGFTLVERPDLVVRQGRVWLRTIGRTGGTGLDPVDVVYRRVGDAGLDPLELGAASDAGVPGLLDAASNGGVVLVNAHGSGLIEDPELVGAWAGAASALGAGALPLEPLGDAAPQGALATYPAFRAGEVTTTAATVRLHAVAGPDGIAVMAGGNGRVLAPGDDPRQPQARRAKDVWVVDYRVRPTIAAPPLPQVDLADSVPTRAAEAMFRTGRAIERADSIARLVHVVSARRRQDPGLARYADGAWTKRVVAALRAVRGDAGSGRGDGTGDEGDGGDRADPGRALDDELDSSTAMLAATLRGMIADAASVGEFLAADASRGFTVLADRLERLDDTASPIDVLDDILAALASLMGMWNESIVRGPAWRFGEIGLRVERARVVAALLAACVADADADTGEGDGDVLASSVEVMLAANESLVAYRRRYRSDVEMPALLDLMLRDRDNPRSFLSCLDRLAEHVADIEWGSGYSKVAALARLAHATDQPLAARVAAATRGLDALLADVVTRWFATPVKPQLVRHTRRTTPAETGIAPGASAGTPT